MISLDWSVFKAIIDAGASFRYFDLGDGYLILIVDSSIIFGTNVLKDGGPDQDDFEDNYQSSAASFSQGGVPFSSTATVTQVASSASSVTVLAANPKRKGVVFVNDSTQICYIKFGATASTLSYTLKIDANSTMILEVNPIYTGRIDGIWVSANGVMAVTELI